MLSFCLQINMMRMLFPVINSSDEAGQKKIIRLQITDIMNQQRGYQKTQTLPQQISKINDTSQGKEKKFPFIKLRDNKTLQQKQKKEAKAKARKKEKVTFLILILIQFIMQPMKYGRLCESPF